MTANGKIQITINSSYTDGEFFRFTDEYLQQNRVVLADAIVRTIDHSDLSLLELRIIVPSQHADELIVGMVTGETEIAIGKMSPVMETD
jgi:hypothetical protein